MPQASAALHKHSYYFCFAHRFPPPSGLKDLNRSYEKGLPEVGDPLMLHSGLWHLLPHQNVSRFGEKVNKEEAANYV